MESVFNAFNALKNGCRSATSLMNYLCVKEVVELQPFSHQNSAQLMFFADVFTERGVIDSGEKVVSPPLRRWLLQRGSYILLLILVTRFPFSI